MKWQIGARAARLSFWSPFAGVLAFVLPVAAGATKAAGHPVLMFVVVGISTLIFAAGLILGIAGLRRMKAEGRQGILGRALTGVALDGVLLGLMLWLTGFLIHDAQREASTRERAAELEAQQLTAKVGGGAALEKALVETANRNFALAFQSLQKEYDARWAALTNPPVLDMAGVTSPGELQARAAAVRRLIQAATDLQEFTGRMPEIYERELRRHKLSAEAREAGLQQFVAAIAAANPAIIAERRAEVRKGEALLRMVILLDKTWGRWQYLPATRELAFKDANQSEDYNVACQEFAEISGEAQSLQDQLRPRK